MYLFVNRMRSFPQFEFPGSNMYSLNIEETLIVCSERRSSAARPYISSPPRLVDILRSPHAVQGSFITATQTCNQSLLPEQMSPLGQIPLCPPAIKIKLDFISKLLLIQRSLVC